MVIILKNINVKLCHSLKNSISVNIAVRKLNLVPFCRADCAESKTARNFEIGP
jgi:hypothetical protein